MPVPLRGDRITIGRLPDNTVQIRDRTVSAHHAEIVAEGDHYRLHDLQATNGLMVNGQAVSDFHLREACRIAFGGVECEFDPNGAEEAPESLHLISQSEREVLTREVGDLKKQLEAMRREREALLKAHAESTGATVPQADFDRVVGDNTSLVEIVAERDREIERLKSELSVIRHDRDVLQREFQNARTAAPEVRVVPVKPAEPVAATPPVAPPPAAQPPVMPPAAGPKTAEPKFDPDLAPPLFQRVKPVAPSAPGIPAAASAKPGLPGKPTGPLQATGATTVTQPQAPAAIKPFPARPGAPTAAPKGTVPLKPIVTPKVVAKTQRIG